MFRCKFTFILALLPCFGICIFPNFCLAQESNTVLESESSPPSLQIKTVTFSYLSWTEFVDLDNGTVTDRAFANFYGNSLSFEKETYQTGQRAGSIFEGALMFGQANAGGSQSVITYQKSYQKWWGLEVSARMAYRISSLITLSAGPLVLVRQISWPQPDAAVDVKSGAQINVGASAELRMRLNRQWELRQTIGTLAFKASTLWSIGIGYKF